MPLLLLNHLTSRIRRQAKEGAAVLPPNLEAESSIVPLLLRLEHGAGPHIS